MKGTGLLLTSIVLSSCSFSYSFSPLGERKGSNEETVLSLHSLDKDDDSVLELYRINDGGETIFTFHILDKEGGILTVGYRYVLDYDDFHFSLALYESKDTEPVFADIEGDVLSIHLGQTYICSELEYGPKLLENRTMFLEIDSNLVKKVYEVNEELDTSGLILKKHLNSGEIVDIDSSDYTIDSVDLSTPGYKEVFVRYGGFLSSYRVIVKGYVYRNYDERHVYYIGEEFDRNLFSLLLYDEEGEHAIEDYEISFPDNSKVGLGELRISHGDFTYTNNVAIIKRQDNVPLIFSSTSSSYLVCFASNIHEDSYNEIPTTVAEGYYLLVREDGSLELYDFTYLLYKANYASYFGSSSHDVIQRLLMSGDLLVEIKGERFVVENNIWHHCIIGW